VDWDLELLHLFIADSGCLEGFKSESKDAQRVVNVHFGNTKRLSLANVADQKSGGVENSLIEKRTLNNCLI
jgi:hypothetical protein